MAGESPCSKRDPLYIGVLHVKTYVVAKYTPPLVRCPQPMSTDPPTGTESTRMDWRLVWCGSLESGVPEKMSSLSDRGSKSRSPFQNRHRGVSKRDVDTTKLNYISYLCMYDAV
ncbi:hypothetical protein AVEN_5816-1 [Araneus ventricosus]|uniref:Uncharacterized protein n=1 Tax=Araneus ventricosus TaxID=182803 RepID=A0A4Y2R746_ARAVE|nr:hypothetical protein AVEN_5816-1 [Araneus ventricosus]